MSTDTIRFPAVRRGAKRARVAHLVALALGLAGLLSATAATARTTAGVVGNNASTLATIEIKSVDLRETAQGAELIVEGDGPLVWTQYRNDAGDLIVELPNTVLGDDVLPPAPRGVVSSVGLEPEANGSRPLTRLVVSTNRAADHTLFVNDGLLTLSFQVAMATPINLPGATNAAATTPARSPASSAKAPTVAVATTSAAGSGMGMGTPEEPQQGPAPTGTIATRLFGVEVVELDGSTALRIEGDGQFEYTTFRLENPPRFVIDLQGVVNSARQTRVSVGGAEVDQVRVAQFRPYPDPVSRVVLDLVGAAMPLLESAQDGLWVRFSAAAMTTTQATPAATPEPSVTMPASSALTAQVELDGSATESEAMPMAAEVVPPVPEVMEVAEEEGELATESFYAEPEPLESAPLATAAAQQPVASAPVFSEVEATEFPAQETAPEFADPEPVAVLTAEVQEPLRITDSTRRESPPPVSDVSLFEAQQIQISPPAVRRDEPRGFAVQRLDTESRWVGEPITLTVKDADLSEVLRTIARYAELNLVVQPGISAPVTVEFIAVPWDQALDQILKINRLDKQLEGSILRVARKDLFRQEAIEDQQLAQARALSVPLSTVIKRLSYADANQVAQILTRGQSSQGNSGGGAGGGNRDTGILSLRGSVNVDRRTNTLILKELPSYLDTVIQVIENLDIPEKQVMIEARIVETTRNFSRSLGIDWSFGGAATAATGNTTGLIFPNRVEAGGGVQLLTGGDNGFFNLSLGNVLNTLQIDLALQAAENEGLVNVISSPKIATLNNNQASIETGLQLPVQTVTGGGGTTAGGLVNPFGTVSVNFIRASLRLQVTPQVTFEGTILMNVNIEKDEPQFALQVPGAPSAPIATRRATTRVRVADGGTAVIGGIYQVSANESEARVPGLARIPILGQLFKNRDRSNQNQELLIFITPRVIQQ